MSVTQLTYFRNSSADRSRRSPQDRPHSRRSRKPSTIKKITCEQSIFVELNQPYQSLDPRELRQRHAAADDGVGSKDAAAADLGAGLYDGVGAQYGGHNHRAILDNHT